jgi:hypothetical protein
MQMNTMIRVTAACMVGLASAVTFMAAEPSERTDGADASIAVRALTFKPTERPFNRFGGGTQPVTIMKDATAMEKLLGKDAAKELSARVDFTKEWVVRVIWSTGGPPDGRLEHEVQGNGQDRRLVFYVQGPAGGQQRGARETCSADFFVIPKDVAVTFDAIER